MAELKELLARQIDRRGQTQHYRERGWRREHVALPVYYHHPSNLHPAMWRVNIIAEKLRNG